MNAGRRKETPDQDDGSSAKERESNASRRQTTAA